MRGREASLSYGSETRQHPSVTLQTVARRARSYSTSWYYRVSVHSIEVFVRCASDAAVFNGQEIRLYGRLFASLESIS